MIRNFKNKIAEDIYNGVNSRYTRNLPSVLHKKAQRLLDQINSATNVESLRVPPGNNLEKLKGTLKNYWSIRINKQWRIVFIWNNGEAINVDLIDYH